MLEKIPTMRKLINVAVKDGHITPNEMSASYIMDAAKEVAAKWDQLMPEEKKVFRNKKASFNYFLLDTFEAGIVLQGTEIKSVRENKVNIGDAHCIIRREELFIVNMHIAKYDHGNIFNHDETRQRKLLLHKKQIIKIEGRESVVDFALSTTSIPAIYVP